jgi:putative phage-type endonuclease
VNDVSRSEWLQERRSGIGGSDIAAVLGLSPFRTPMDVYLDKRGELEAAPPKNAEAMYWGSVLEDVVAREYQVRTSRKIQRVTTMLTHPEYPWVLANVDRAVIAPQIAGNVRWKNGRLTTDRILECKTANGFAASEWGEVGSDRIPDHYLLQCQWYLGITRADVADVAVLIGGNDYRLYTVARDDELFSDLLDSAREFWLRVQDGIAPDPMTVADAVRKWPKHIAGKSTIVDVSVAEACRELADIAAERKRLDEREDALKTAVMGAFGDAEEISYMGRRLATWKSQASTRVDTKRLKQEMPDIAAQFSATTDSRVFRLTKAKE